MDPKMSPPVTALTPQAQEVLRRRSPRMLKGFNRYLRWYLRRNLHRVLILDSHAFPRLDDTPLLIYFNHPSWWDPLIGMYLADQLMPERIGFAPIDAKALEKYRFFEKLGVFGVEQDTQAGARHFLKVARSLLHVPGHTLWITAEGHFTDPRKRPVTLKPGLAHLARSLPNLILLPMAIEIALWQERTPEVLIAFGSPILTGPGNSLALPGAPAVDNTLTPAGTPVPESGSAAATAPTPGSSPAHGRSPEAENLAGPSDQPDPDATAPTSTTAALLRRLESALEQTQDALAQAAISRDESLFSPLLDGKTGVGGFYDLWRRLKAMMQGKRFDPSHASGLARNNQKSP